MSPTKPVRKKTTPKKKAVSKKSPAKKSPAKKSPTKKPEVLVTGAAGALAQLVISILKLNYNVVALDARHMPQIGTDIASYKLDMNKREFEEIFRNHNITKVIHLGRISSHQSNREARYNANVIGTQKLLDLCVKYGVKQVIILSTFHVYGANAYNPALIDEEAPLKAAEITMDLVDSVELENLASIYLWKHPSINVTLLRACNIVGPGINNTMSKLLSGRYAPYLFGFSPMMQFIHVADMASAIVQASKIGKSGIYNVAPDDWVSYSKALELCEVKPLPVPSSPLNVPKLYSKIIKWKIFPSHLVNYFKYSVIIDGKRFREHFDFKTEYSMDAIFTYYRDMKKY